jgi:DDE superfamily endonuclease
LVGEVRLLLPARPGQAARYDCEYVRNGTANLFMAFEPFGGRCRSPSGASAATGPASSKLWQMAATRTPTIVLVMDQLNIHALASLYEAFPPQEARRIADRLEVHHTPKHGSWLNMAEIELSVFRRDLPERISDRASLERHAAAWQRRRNAATTRADWRFTTADARIKLRKLYPSV